MAINQVATLRKGPLLLNNSNTAFNYGQQVQSGTAFYNSAKVAADFTLLYNSGVRKLRIGGANYSFVDGVNATKLVAQQAKAAGFYVTFLIGNLGFATDTDANWATYTAAVNAAADWAWANGMDEFQTGNELEYSQTSGTLSNAYNKIIAMGLDVITNHFFADGITRFMSYAVAQDSLESTWISSGKGTYNLIGYNVYGSNGDFTNFQTKINAMFAAFGTSLYLSEWNLNNNFSNFPQPESAQTTQIQARFNFIQSLGLVNYFFTYRWDTNNDQFALFKADGTFRGWYSVFFQSAPRATAPNRSIANNRVAALIY